MLKLKYTSNVEALSKTAVSAAYVRSHDAVSGIHFLKALIEHEDKTDPYLQSIVDAVKKKQSEAAAAENAATTEPATSKPAATTNTTNTTQTTYRTWETLVNAQLTAYSRESRQRGLTVSEAELQVMAGSYLEQAEKFRKQQGATYLTRDHVVMLMLEDSDVCSLLSVQAISADELQEQLALAGLVVAPNAYEDSASSALREYTVDMTQQAKRGEFDPVLGRDAEIEQCLLVLARRKKCNAVVLGAPGVGKSAMVEGVAQRLAQDLVPPGLKGARLVSLDIGALRAGAQYHGDLEKRIKGIVDVIEASETPIILFIDEIHMLMGNGTSDAANLLKPLLSRSRIRCIGATTHAEYRKHVMIDAAFERRFEQIRLEEPSEEVTVDILRGLKKQYEKHYGVQVLDEALVAAAKLAHRYLTYRRLPDSAVDLVESAASMAALSVHAKSESVAALERDLARLQLEADSLRGDGRTSDTHAHLRDVDAKIIQKELDICNARDSAEDENVLLLRRARNQRDEYQSKIKAAIAKDTEYYDLQNFAMPKVIEDIANLEYKVANKVPETAKSVVDADAVRRTASKISGIPDTNLTKDETLKMRSLRETLEGQIVGQREAIDAVYKAILRKQYAFNRVDIPASFLFLGTTGSGKTELAKKLAGFLFADEKSMVRIDCSELQDRGSVTKLIGAPPGYVGYDEGGILTEALRTRPYAVVLFDEIEKAAPEVLTILLQILDNGSVRSSTGAQINCAHAIVVMTSNLGAEIVSAAAADVVDEATRAGVMTEVRKFLRPELVNRISSIVVFNRLSRHDIEAIMRLRVDEYVQYLKNMDQKITIELDAPVYDFLLAHGYSSEYGARPLNRLIEDEICSKIAEQMIERRVQRNDTVRIVLETPPRTGLRVLANHVV